MLSKTVNNSLIWSGTTMYITTAYYQLLRAAGESLSAVIQQQNATRHLASSDSAYGCQQPRLRLMQRIHFCPRAILQQSIELFGCWPATTPKEIKNKTKEENNQYSNTPNYAANNSLLSHHKETNIHSLRNNSVCIDLNTKLQKTQADSTVPFLRSFCQ